MADGSFGTTIDPGWHAIRGNLGVWTSNIAAN